MTEPSLIKIPREVFGQKNVWRPQFLTINSNTVLVT